MIRDVERLTVTCLRMNMGLEPIQSMVDEEVVIAFGMSETLLPQGDIDVMLTSWHC